MSLPDLWERDPPIRYRKSVPDTWIEVGITEGRNRQVRRMTAAVGLPTLRLIRRSVGPWTLDGLQPGHLSARSTTDDAWAQIRAAKTLESDDSPSPSPDAGPAMRIATSIACS